MTETTSEQDLARDHQRLQQLVRSTVKAFIACIAIGLIGGYLLYQILPAGRWPALVLYIPGLLAIIPLFWPIRKRKKEWFPTDESLKAAGAHKPIKLFGK